MHSQRGGYMKKILLVIIGAALLTLTGCATTTDQPTETEISYEDGTYRGIFADGGEFQVGVQFKLSNNVVESVSFRQLAYKGVDYLKSEEALYIGWTTQYTEAFEHLIGKDIREALTDLYNPGDLEITDVDTFTGATIRANKILSAIRDALNRGVYSY